MRGTFPVSKNTTGLCHEREEGQFDSLRSLTVIRFGEVVARAPEREDHEQGPKGRVEWYKRVTGWYLLRAKLHLPPND